MDNSCPWYEVSKQCWTWSYIATAVFPYIMRGCIDAATSKLTEVAGEACARCLKVLGGGAGTSFTFARVVQHGSKLGWSQILEEVSSKEALMPALARLIFWHLSQPVGYFYILFWCISALENHEMLLAVVVLVREALYVMVTMLLAICYPSFLFLAPGDVIQWMWFVASPEKIVFLTFFQILYYDASRRGNWVKGLVLTILTVVFDCAAVCGLVIGIRTGAPAALMIGYAVVAASTPVSMFLAFRGLSGNDLDDGL